MLIDRWEIISAVYPHGLRSPEESFEEMNNGISPRIQGLVYYHPTNDFGIFGISDGSIFEHDFRVMPDANSISLNYVDDIEIGEPSEMYERTFPNAKFRLFKNFDIARPSDDEIPKIIEPDPPTEEELEQEERDNFDSIDECEDDEENDDWDWFGYQFREDNDDTG